MLGIPNYGRQLLWIKIIMILSVVVAPLMVTAERQGGQLPGANSRSVRKGVQGFAAAFFGCPGLNPTSANVTCSHKIEKMSKGIDCSSKMPIRTKAKFTCLNDTVMSVSYDEIVCRLPGRWKPAPPTCAPKLEETTTITTTTTTTAPTVSAATPEAAKAETATGEAAKAVAAKAEAATKIAVTIKASTEQITTTGVPLLLPIGVKKYDNVPLALFTTGYSPAFASSVCTQRSEKQWVYDDTPAASSAQALDLLTTFNVTPSSMQTAVQYNIYEKYFWNHAGFTNVSNRCPIYILNECTRFNFVRNCLEVIPCGTDLQSNFICTG